MLPCDFSLGCPIIGAEVHFCSICSPSQVLPLLSNVTAFPVATTLTLVFISGLQSRQGWAEYGAASEGGTLTRRGGDHRRELTESSTFPHHLQSPSYEGSRASLLPYHVW